MSGKLLKGLKQVRDLSDLWFRRIIPADGGIPEIFRR